MAVQTKEGQKIIPGINESETTNLCDLVVKNLQQKQRYAYK